jgi:hypothetical protein
VDDQERREAAIARLQAKREFWTHLFVYVAVNGLLILVWAVSAGGGHFWPMWPLAGWGIGLAVHAWETFQQPIGEDAIRREMDKGGGLEP